MTNRRVRVYQLLVTLLIAFTGWTYLQIGPTPDARAFGTIVLWLGVTGVFYLVGIAVGTAIVSHRRDPA